MFPRFGGNILQIRIHFSIVYPEYVCDRPEALNREMKSAGKIYPALRRKTDEDLPKVLKQLKELYFIHVFPEPESSATRHGSENLKLETDWNDSRCAGMVYALPQMSEAMRWNHDP
jgi:hypothetical protein